MKEKNLIFEGWNDKQLFQLAVDHSSAELKKRFRDVGICHARGVKSIKAITPLIELAQRQCMIISDNDKPAKDQQKIYKQERGFGEWKTYQDIDKKIEAVTGEDFIKNDFITKYVKNVLSGTNMPEFNASMLPDKKGKIDAVSRWLNTNGMTADQTKDTITKIKNEIFDNLKGQHIEDSYTYLLQAISLIATDQFTSSAHPVT